MKASIKKITRKTELIERSGHRMDVALTLPKDKYYIHFMKRELRLQFRRCLELTFLLIMLGLRLKLCKVDKYLQRLEEDV